MLQVEQVEELVSLVSGLHRDTLVEQFHNFQATFPIDFTPDFLGRQTTERLRHLFIALCLQQQRMPELAASEVV